MGLFVVIIRMPIGVLASAVLLVWSLLVFLVYCLFFIFLSIFGKLTQINERLNPWLQTFNGVKCLPGLWNWVLRPCQGIFEPPPPDGDDAEVHSGALLNRYRSAMAQQQQQQQPQALPNESAKVPDGTRPSSLSSDSSSTTNRL